MRKNIFMLVGVIGIVALGVILFNNSGSCLTINVETNQESTVIFNGRVVGKNSASIEVATGVNRIVVKATDGTYWVGQWEAKEGTADEFLDNVKATGNYHPNQSRKGTLDLEIVF
ncbi:hypothetical protein PRVXH_000833 [Proteinivorax hydrogeniformans]|uniref:PEGA domain-containing protein n=1 Tax=Proteinivorax hydrogeniformans TaxID=1826727 RepID=A0AAU8HVW0_9FIRM